MTSNPLARRRPDPADYEPFERTDAGYMYDLLAHMNRKCTRPDLEWVLGENGPYLRDKPSWTAARIRAAEMKIEADREKWKAAQRRLTTHQAKEI